jgi:uncharacterized protein (UPF0248 family)
MTYAQLAALIHAMPADRAQDDVTCYIGDEYIPLHRLVAVNDSDILDKGHFVLCE